jgi:polyhydroxybutyrate depolymerase
LLHVPPAYDGGTAAPLVIALHAEATTAGHLRMLTELDSAVDERGTIAVYPEGSDELGLGVWNAESFASGLDDSLFLSDLLDVLAEELCVNEARVYVAGMSQGGAMALRFACDAPERVAAVSPVAAPYVACQAPVPMVAFHGSKDPLVPYEGGVSPLTEQPSPPVHRAASEWARALGCDGLATISRPTADVELATYRNCSGSGADVLLYNAIEGGHTWPGATIDAPEENAGKTTHSISATELMLDFFERQQR